MITKKRIALSNLSSSLDNLTWEECETLLHSLQPTITEAIGETCSLHKCDLCPMSRVCTFLDDLITLLEASENEKYEYEYAPYFGKK